jgi:hypothetical protein
MANNAIKATSYSALAAKILEETLVLPNIGHREFQNPTDSFKVWVAGDESMVTYVPGTPATATDPAGDYVTINNPTDKAIYKVIDKNQLRKVYNPVEHIDQLVVKSIQAASVNLDSAVMEVLLSGGTAAYIAKTPVAAGSLVEGSEYIVLVANSAGDATDVGCAATTAVVGETFTCLADVGSSETALSVALYAATTGDLLKAQVIAMEKLMNDNKAPIEGRYLIVTTAMAALFESALILQTNYGDSIQANGFKTIGTAYGFTILMSLYTPDLVNMIALHADAFGGNFEQIEPIELIEVPRGNGTIGAWAVDGRMAYNYGVLRAGLVQIG